MPSNVFLVMFPPGARASGASSLMGGVSIPNLMVKRLFEGMAAYTVIIPGTEGPT